MQGVAGCSHRLSTSQTYDHRQCTYEEINRTAPGQHQSQAEGHRSAYPQNTDHTQVLCGPVPYGTKTDAFCEAVSH